MINIKTILKQKNVTTNSSTSSSNASNNSSQTNDWFYYDSDNNAVACRYDFYSVGNVSALGSDTSSDGSSSTGGSTVVVDNLESSSTTYALSANQGRVLKTLIDNIDTTTVAEHTHEISDVNGLSSELTDMTNHMNSSTLHLSETQYAWLNTMMSMIRYKDGQIKISADVVSTGDVIGGA